MARGRTGREEITTVHIGKNGLTESILEEVRKRLRKHGRVKIKINRNLIKTGVGVDNIARSLSEQTGSRIVDARGHTVILEKSVENR